MDRNSRVKKIVKRRKVNITNDNNDNNEVKTGKLETTLIITNLCRYFRWNSGLNQLLTRTEPPTSFMVHWFKLQCIYVVYAHFKIFKSVKSNRNANMVLFCFFLVCFFFGIFFFFFFFFCRPLYFYSAGRPSFITEPKTVKEANDRVKELASPKPTHSRTDTVR